MLVSITSLTHHEGMSVCVCVCVRERHAKDRREWRKGEERRGVVGPSFMLNKAVMGNRLGTASQAETGLLPFVHGGFPQEGGGGGKDGVSTICLLREKSMQKLERDVLVRWKMCLYVCLCWSRRETNRRGGVGPSLSRCRFCLQKQTPLNPTLLHCKKTENNNKSKQRASLPSPNGFKSSLPVVTADERIIKHRAALTERSHAVQAAIHATTVCLFIACSGIRTILI